jgi:hypothetical protein
MKYKIEVAFETNCLISLEKMKEFVPYWIGEIERNWIPIQNLATSVQEIAEIKQEKAQELDIVAHAIEGL